MKRRDVEVARGFSLIEVLAAMTILSVALAVLAQLLATSITANSRAQTATSASVLAVEKMEQLRGLAWGFDALGLPLSDLTSDLTAVPERPTGGVGLTPSPPGALGRNMPGYCDFIDTNGRPLGGGLAPPTEAAFIRRWSIESLPTNPANTLVLQVAVMRAIDREALATRLVTLRTRKAS